MLKWCDKVGCTELIWETSSRNAANDKNIRPSICGLRSRDYPSIQDEATVKVAAYQMPTQAIMRPGPNHDDAAKAGSPNYMARFIGPSPQVTKGGP